MHNRRNFFKYAAVLGSSMMFREVAHAKDAASHSNFVLWQLDLNHTPSQGNAYIFRTPKGKIIVMDGGMPGEADYLRGFLAPLGNEVEAWFVSHPHIDHVGALNEILKDPKGIRIKSIYHSELSRNHYEREPDNTQKTEDFYNNLKKTTAQVTDIAHLGWTIEIDKVKFKILALKNEEITANPYNNSSMVIRAWDTARSVVFLGDAGIEEGDKLLKGDYRKDLDCDYLQMAHHGQNGVSKEFYRSIKFKACLWPTPLWLWTNNNGTGPFKTLETRAWIEELGILKHFVMWEGLGTIA
jgi:beta-lactamase superfamily II metal-dependent hydrolase